MRNIYILILFLFASDLYSQSGVNFSYESLCRDHPFQVGSGVTDELVSVSYGTLFPNYILPDINGVSHDLHSILNQGKSVVLEVMEFSGSLSLEEVKYLNHIKEIYQDQEGLIELFAIERTAHINISLNVQNWYDENNLNYPLINMDGLDTFLDGEVIGLPTFFIIAPDKSYTKVFNFNYAHHILSTINKEVLASSGLDSNYDLDLFNVEHDFCGDTKNVYFTLQNTGSENTYPFTVMLYADSNVFIDSISVDRLIMPNERIEFSVALTTSIVSSNNMRIEIVSSQPLENAVNNIKSFSFVENQNFSGTEIEIRLQPDSYPGELAWVLTNTTTSQVIDFDGLNTANEIVGISGGLHVIPESLNEGDCYLLTLYDSVGDGICCSYGNGYIKIVDSSSGMVIVEGEDFDISEALEFKVNSSIIGVDEIKKPIDQRIIKKIQYFDILGREFVKLDKGFSNTIIIKKTTFLDNSVETEKIHAY